MKILQVIPYFTPSRGGDVNVCYNLSKQLVKHGHEVTVITTDFEFDEGYAQTLEKIGAKVIPFHCIANIKLFLISPGMKKWLKINVRDFDMIHLHSYHTFQNLIAHHYAKKYGIPYVVQAHGSVATYFQKGTLKRIFDRLCGYRILKDASKLIALAPAEVEQYKSMGVNKDKIEIVPNGIDLSEFENLPPRGEFRRKHGLNSEQKIILYLGRIHKTKGIDLLVRAFDKLSQEVTQVRLVIAGPDEGYLSSLKKLVMELKISDKVLFTGPLYGKNKLEAYIDADIHALPCAWESFGLTLLEACACGTPVICSKQCGIADIIDGQAGLVVPYDKDQLSDAILRMLNNDEMSQEFGKKGRSLVHKQFTWEKIVEQIETMYQRILQGRT